MLRPLSMMAFVVLSAGCLQIAGVSDYKVEEACVVPAGAKCRVAPNCGCQPSETCALVSADGAGDCKPAGSVGSGGDCSTNEECAPGMACLGGRCGKYCVTHDDCESKACSPIELGGTPVTSVGICVQTCDPVDATACRDGEACRFTTNGKTSCFANPGSGNIGASCTTDDNCAPTLFCASNVCARLCVAGSTCDTGACGEALVTANGTAYGVCPTGG